MSPTDTAVDKPSTQTLLEAAWESDDDLSTSAGDAGVSGAEETPGHIAPTPTAPAVADAPAPGVDRGDGRDVNGKWVSKTKPDPDAAPVTPKGIAKPAAEEALTPVVPATTPVAPAPTPEPEGQPWRVRVSGQELDTGAVYIPGKGLMVPEPVVAAFQTAIQEGVYYKQNWKKLETEAEQKGEDRGRGVSTKLMDQMLAMVEKVKSGNAEQQLEVLRWFLDFDAKLPLMQAEHERDQLKAQIAARTQTETQRAEEATQSQVSQHKEAFLTQTLATIKAQPEYKVLTPADWTDIAEQVADTRDSYWVQQNGSWYLDEGKLAKLCTKRAGLRSEMAQSAKATEEAARFNKGMTAPGKPATAAPKSVVSTLPAEEAAPLTKAQRRQKELAEFMRSDEDDE